MTDEFIDAYSDDQIYLEIIEKLINEHPTEGNVPDNIKYSSYSRLWIVMMVGSIEMMIKKWAIPEPMMHDIASYFNDGSNEGRLEHLYKAFELRGLSPKRECFDDYLACKYIRNAYVHGEWNENQRKYVESKGLPSTIMRFSPIHYKRVKDSYYHLMNLLGIAKATNEMSKLRHL
ncbi:hypothetical protein ACE38U_04915 [Cedecea sp. S5-13]|uniref:hypothetical protein n=1 Tax=Cedecea selenatireducens TaxID=3144416 RepID=UPI0035CD0691